MKAIMLSHLFKQFQDDGTCLEHLSAVIQDIHKFSREEWNVLTRDVATSKIPRC